MSDNDNTYVGEASGDEVASLAPREISLTSTRRRFGSRRSIIIGSCVAIVILGFFVVKAVGDAGVYFRTADEAVAQRESLGTKRFRLEGCVVAGSVVEQGNDVRFAVAGQTTSVAVLHQGTPPELFQENIPVVLEGHWSDTNFASDLMLVRHSETYAEKNEDRVSPTQCTSNAAAARAN